MDGVCHTAYVDNEQQQSNVTYPCVPEWVASDLFSEREEKLQKRWEKRQQQKCLKLVAGYVVSSP